MKEISFHREAIVELNESIIFYEEKVNNLGKNFLAEVEKAAKEIQKSPRKFPFKTRSTRHYLLKKFPFSIVYYELNNSIVVIAIAHWKRKPNYWRKRLSK